MTLFQQGRPHFIRMDIHMPEMDGHQAMAKIGSLPQGMSVKVVALTTGVLNDQSQSILGFDGGISTGSFLI